MSRLAGLLRDGKWLVLTESKGAEGKGYKHSCGETIIGKRVYLTEQDHITKMLDPLAGGGETRAITVPYCPKCEKEPMAGWLDINTGKATIL